MTKKVTPFPVRLDPIQEACQKLNEIHPTWAFIILFQKEKGYSFMLPPDVNLSDVYFGTVLAQDSLVDMAYESEFD